MHRGQVVLVDTNIIIEAVRTGCWTALTTHFEVHTVENCCAAARTGDAPRPGYVIVDEKALRTRLVVQQVSALELATLRIKDLEAFRLDPGERDLWSHALARTDAWVASCCDQAAVGAAVRLGWGD